MDMNGMTDLSGEDPVIRILFFLFVPGAIACGFIYVMKKGMKEEMYIHPVLKRIIDVLFHRQ